ncbi:MAG: ABC transporter substrate-binding protein [Limnochordia bacterium]|jgi:branched-chain amino acid transport system substrate-binding protein
MKKRFVLVCVLSLVLALSGMALAENVIKVGAIYPLSGPMAGTGQMLKNGVLMAVDIINNKHDFDFIFADTEGLPNMGGAKIEIIFADSAGDPKTGMSEAERLITSEGVVALVGCYQSSVTKTASQVAERYGIPYVNGDSSSPELTARGFKWFFRTDPHDGLYARQQFEHLVELERQWDESLRRVAIIHENTEFGTQLAKAQENLAKEFGFEVVERLAYTTGATSLNSEVTRLMAAKPDVVMMNAYISDQILFTKTFKTMRFAPTVWHNSAAPGEPDYLSSVGADGNYLFLRQGFCKDQAVNKPVINEVLSRFRAKFGQEMLADAVRSFHAPIALADAINRAGSTEPEAIRQALLETNIPGKYCLSPWEGIKFDPETHQNVYGQYIICQIQEEDFFTVYPDSFATREAVFPFPSWEGR